MENEQTTKPKIGVLLVNLGTPEAPETSALRKYLGELLAEPRLVEAPRAVWWLVRHLFILPFRPKRIAALYKEIWMPEGSPLMVYTIKQAAKLAAKLDAAFDGEVSVEVGMCVSSPSVRDALERLQKKGAQGLLILPLFPQYTSSATGAAFDAVFSVLRTWRVVPQLRTINGFHDHPAYITALVSQVKTHWEKNGRGDKLVMSFHGLPRSCIIKGEPYASQCFATAELVAKGLGLEKSEYLVTFQSRFGPGEWLRPYTDASLKELAYSGVHVLDVLCPGFAADCLETLHEIAVEGREIFVKHGGKDLRYIPALNDADAFIDALAGIVMESIS